MTLPTPYYSDDAVTIYHADCRDILPLISPVGVTITSPPYNLAVAIDKNGFGRSRHGRGKPPPFQKYGSYSDDLTPLEYFSFTSAVLSACLDAGPLVFWNTSIATGNKWATAHLFGQFADRFKELIVWDKGGSGQPSMNRGVVATVAEIVAVFATEAAQRSFDFDEHMANIWRISPPTPTKGHGACYPSALVHKCLLMAPHGVVLDPFMGSGTTLRAAKDLGRKAIGIEIDERYCEIAARRMGQEVLDL